MPAEVSSGLQRLQRSLWHVQLQQLVAEASRTVAAAEKYTAPQGPPAHVVAALRALHRTITAHGEAGGPLPETAERRAPAEAACASLDACILAADRRTTASVIAAAREELAKEEAEAAEAAARARLIAEESDPSGERIEAALHEMSAHPERYDMFDVSHNRPPPTRAPQGAPVQEAAIDSHMEGSSASFQQCAASVLESWLASGSGSREDSQGVREVLQRADTIAAAAGVDFVLLPPGRYDVGHRVGGCSDGDLDELFQVPLEPAFRKHNYHPLWPYPGPAFVDATPQCTAEVERPLLVSVRPLTRAQLAKLGSAFPDLQAVRLPDPVMDDKVFVPHMGDRGVSGYLAVPRSRPAAVARVSDALMVDCWTADAICRALGGRVLHWHEWEAAARGVDGNLFAEGLSPERALVCDVDLPSGKESVALHVLRDAPDSPTPFGLGGVAQVGAREWNGCPGAAELRPSPSLLRPPATHVIRSAWELGVAQVLTAEGDPYGVTAGANPLLFTGPSLALYAVPGGGFAVAGVRLALPLPVRIGADGCVAPLPLPAAAAPLPFRRCADALGRTVAAVRELLGHEEELALLPFGRDREASWYSKGLSVLFRGGRLACEVQFHSGRPPKGPAPPVRYAPCAVVLPGVEQPAGAVSAAAAAAAWGPRSEDCSRTFALPGGLRAALLTAPDGTTTSVRITLQ